MDFSFSEEEEAFRQEVRTFLDENLTERLRAGSRGSPGVFVEPCLLYTSDAADE